MNKVQGGRIRKKQFRENKIDPKIENRGAYPLKIDLYGSKFNNFVIFVKHQDGHWVITRKNGKIPKRFHVKYHFRFLRTVWKLQKFTLIHFFDKKRECIVFNKEGPKS